MRYGWHLKLTPSKCRCGEGFDVNHVLVCRQVGFNTIRHIELCDTFSSLLREVCQEVTTEPCLQPVSGETFPRSTNTEANARLDIRARGCWDNMQDAFFDVRSSTPSYPHIRPRSFPHCTNNMSGRSDWNMDNKYGKPSIVTSPLWCVQ